MPTPAAARSRPADPQADEIAGLRDELAARERALAAAVAAGETAAAEALTRGQAEGREEAESGDRERLTLLRDGIEQALAALDARVAGERDLAVDIAQAALDRILGDAISYRTLVAETAHHHAAALSQGAIVRLRVSAEDFPDADALATLTGFDRQVDVTADPALAAGGCVFDLTLGSLDASIPAQAVAVADLLHHVRRDEARAA